MTDYKEIKGKTVLSIASDLDNTEGQGQIWFNTTSGDFKTIQKVAGAWATGGSLNTGRFDQLHAGAGTATAALTFGGATNSPATGVTAVAEKYDGSSWTETGDLNAARSIGAGFGTQTAAFGVAGSTNGPSGAFVDSVESFNGTSWTETTDINTARGYFFGAGSTTAGIVAGGNPPTTGASESWNGTAWTE